MDEKANLGSGKAGEETSTGRISNEQKLQGSAVSTNSSKSGRSLPRRSGSLHLKDILKDVFA